MTLIDDGQSLVELDGVGPFLERVLLRWIEDPPEDQPDPPDIRAHFMTLTDARATVARCALNLKMVNGDLQTHSQWSDGADTTAAMAAEASERGYQYLAVTDHSKGLKIAGGIDEGQLESQRQEIDAVNSQMRASGSHLQLLRSIELNLDPLGRGDMDPVALRQLDLVLGCFHSKLRIKDDQTERYLAALRNPSIQILGHPRGRIFNYRMGLRADWRRVFDLAASLDKAVEIDCYPDRQDLSLDLLLIARKAGCRISLGTDAHGAAQLRFIELGLAAAWRAKIPAERILNFMNREQLLRWVDSVRGNTT
jgi:histidinol phosphatase-like PHP family hydrolase